MTTVGILGGGQLARMMIAPAVGYVATLVVAMPWNDMAKVAGRSSAKGRRVKVPTVV